MSYRKEISGRHEDVYGQTKPVPTIFIVSGGIAQAVNSWFTLY
jgi:hypothetical protein